MTKIFNIACQPHNFVIRMRSQKRCKRDCPFLRSEVVSDTLPQGAKPYLRGATQTPSASPLAGLNRAGYLLDGAIFGRARPKRKYPAAYRIKASIACVEGVHCPDISCANFGFPFDTFSGGTISRGVAPCPFRRILGPRPPAAHFCSVHFPDLVNPAQNSGKFRLRPR
jgi:hypothetical protein